MNYFRYEQIIYDLENNIPFMYLQKGWGEYDEANPNYSNERKVFYDSSRSLSISNPNMLAFTYSKKDV